MRRLAPFAALTILAALLGCSEGGGLSELGEAKLAPEARRASGLTPAPRGALPPPDPVFEAARSTNAEERAAARSLLDEARRSAGLPSGAEAERVSFLDLPDGVLFAAPSSGASFAATPVGGAPPGVRDALRDELIDALGGRVTREKAYLAARRFVITGLAAAGRREGRAALVVEWRLADSAGVEVATIEEHWTALDAGGGEPWAAFSATDLVAVARRSAERILEEPAVREAVGAHVGFGALDPGARRAIRTAGVAGQAGLWPAGEAPPMVVAGVMGQPAEAAALLTAAIDAALGDAGATLAPPEAQQAFADLYVVSAEVALLREGAEDLARIVWRVTRSGRSLGVVRQENRGARGAFDDSWAPQAVAAAQAAAPKLVALVAQDQEAPQ